jgi:N-acetylglucosaminyl-diphospho-decaprenol L-rhamnosyltransferase
MRSDILLRFFMTSFSAARVVGLTLNYRDATRTVRCIDSLLAQGIEQVLVWDNSEDDGASARELAALLTIPEHVSIATENRNLGFAAGVNRGINWIKARFPDAIVLLINNDALLLSGGLEALTSALKAAPQAAIAYPDIDHGGHLIGPVYYHPWLALITYTHLPGSIAYASGCCQLIAPDRLTDPCFDERFFMYGEDMEQGFRLGPTRMEHVPGVWVRHEGSASSGMGSLFYETRMIAAHWLLARKFARNRSELAAMYVGRLFLLSLRALIRACRYGRLTPFFALGAGWRLARRQR